MRYLLLAAGLGLALTTGTIALQARDAAGADAPGVITVHKTPWCGCCGDWVDHLRDDGLEVAVVEHDDLTPLRASLGVPAELASCHTAEVDGYAIEGHVPAQDIRRLLLERPQGVQGLAVPGMPLGSPGMEVGDRRDPFDVIAFGDERRQVFQRYRP